MRSNSRIQYAELLNYDTKFPIILPKNSNLTMLIIKGHHEKTNHGGTNATLAALSQKFWINAARQEIRKWEIKYNIGKRRKTKVTQQVMANLPMHRLGNSLKAFTKIGVDFGGPFLIKQGKGEARAKR